MTRLLPARLRQLGLHDVAGLRLHRNSTVLVSITARGELRLHEGYAEAPDRVLMAIVRFVRPGAWRITRRAALAVIRSWPLPAGAPGAVPRTRAPRVHPADQPIVDRLQARWAALNAEHFGGALRPIPIHISSRMRRKLGELRHDHATTSALRITLSRRLITRYPWPEVEETLLHEMVHQWQAETGLAVDHGAGFRRKAREVGIVPRAMAAPRARSAPTLALLGGFAGLAPILAGCAAFERPPAVVLANDNRIPAGLAGPRWLDARLLLEEGTWFPDDSAGASLVVAAFAERGGAPRIPGPLLRVAEGTEVRVRVENRLALPVVVHGLHARPGRDSLVLAPGTTRQVRFVAGEPGTYFYWAATNGHTLDDRQDYDSQLAGAFIVDPAGLPPTDRVFVIGGWFKDADTAARPVLPIRDVMTINGRAWPHTERLTAALGDSVTWRVINTNLNSHPMHLHGTYFLVGGRGDWARDTVYSEADQRRVVTELMLPGTTMTMRWAPLQPGNWLFHCHFAFHVSPFTSLTRTLAGDTLGHGDHTALRGMAGMVLGISVPAPEGYAEPVAAAEPRQVRLLVQSRPNVFGKATGFGFVVQDGAPPARDSIRMPGTPLVLERGRPVRITVVNHLGEPTAVHWHGIELSSYPDGVPGWSGVGSRVMPPVAPGDSFVAEFTPPRAGTFIYHAHANELVQLAQGLYGALLVMEPGERPDARREATVIVSLDGPSQASAGGWVNGSPTPAPIAVPPGRPFKLRLISINADARVHFRLLRDSTLQSWRPVAVDGADLPPGQAVPRPADWLTGPGMTQDVMIELERGERLDLEVSAPHAAAPWTIVQPVVAR